jgi:hypothetical protein
MMVAAAWTCTGCAPSISSTPTPSRPEPARAVVSPDPACARHLERLRDESCGDVKDDACDVELACAQALDFDGDGARDAVRIVGLPGDAIGLHVSFADHREETIGDAPLALTEIGEPGDVGRTLPRDLSWISAWRVAPRHALEIPSARGDGLWLSGGDAAAMLVLTHDGWLLVELGY